MKMMTIIVIVITAGLLISQSVVKMQN